MTGMPYWIREVTEADVSFLWEMLYESLYVPDGEEPFNRDVIYEPALAKYVEDWGREGDLGMLAVSNDGCLLGAITARYYSEQDRSFGYVSDETPELNLALQPAWRGQGIGSALVSAMLIKLKETGATSVSLSVAPDNEPAMRLYQRYGFIEVGGVGTSLTMLLQLR